MANSIMWLLAASCLISTGLAQPQDADPSQNDGTTWRLFTAFEKKAYAPMENVQLRIVLRNDSASEQELTTGRHPLLEYQIVVYRDGEEWLRDSTTQPSAVQRAPKPLPLTLYGQAQNLLKDVVGSSSIRVLPPKAELTVTFQLNRLFDMSLSGKYNVIVSRLVPGAGEGRAPARVAATPCAVEITDP